MKLIAVIVLYIFACYLADGYNYNMTVESYWEQWEDEFAHRSKNKVPGGWNQWNYILKIKNCIIANIIQILFPVLVEMVEKVLTWVSNHINPM